MPSPMDSFRFKARRKRAAQWRDPTDSRPEETRFVRPEPPRILTGAGLAGSQLQQVLRKRASTARHSNVGPKILRTLGKYLRMVRR